MGQRAPRICSCGAKVPAGESCQCRDARVKARPSAAARGYGSKWKTERAVFLAKPENHQCACGARANTVHHRQAHKGDQRLFWDRKNWAPVCTRCNASECAKNEGGFGNPLGGGLRIYSEGGGRPGVSLAQNKLELSKYKQVVRCD